MRILYYDGTFEVRELEWLADFQAGERDDAWRGRNGFESTPDIECSDGAHELSLAVFRSKARPECLVDVGLDDNCGYMVCATWDSVVQLALTSPMFSALCLMRSIDTIKAIAGRAFQAWHGHRAPDDEDDIFAGCRRCDPGNEDVRVRSRKDAAERRAKREAERQRPTGEGSGGER